MYAKSKEKIPTEFIKLTVKVTLSRAKYEYLQIQNKIYLGFT